MLVPGVLQGMVLARVGGHDLAALPGLGLGLAPRAAARRHHHLGAGGLRVLAHRADVYMAAVQRRAQHLAVDIIIYIIYII